MERRELEERKAARAIIGEYVERSATGSVEHAARLSDKRTFVKDLRRGLRRGTYGDALVYLRPDELDEIGAAVVEARERKTRAVAVLDKRFNGER